MKAEAIKYCATGDIQDARLCFFACLEGQVPEVQQMLMHYSTHAGIKKIPWESAKDDLREIAFRETINRLEYMTKLKQCVHSLGGTL